MNFRKKTGGQQYGVFAVLILACTTSLFFIPVLLIGLLKLIPYKPWQDRCGQLIDAIVSLWCSINNTFVNRMLKIDWDIAGPDNLDKKKWYLVIANHQSWLDIVILQRLFNKKIPILKFFIKDQLKWVPLLGFAWWAMGCPFMKRYSKEYLAKYPHKKGQDVKATLKAVKTFKRKPASVMSFIEGTRFSRSKQQAQNSPHTHLLKPKAGGISFVLSTMGQQLTHILDVTIVYPEKASLWNFLCNRMDHIKIAIRELAIPAEFTTSKVIDDPQTQHDFKQWLNAQWAEKDNLIASLKAIPHTPEPVAN